MLNCTLECVASSLCRVVGMRNAAIADGIITDVEAEKVVESLDQTSLNLEHAVEDSANCENNSNRGVVLNVRNQTMAAG